MIIIINIITICCYVELNIHVPACIVGGYVQSWCESLIECLTSNKQQQHTAHRHIKFGQEISKS